MEEKKLVTEMGKRKLLCGLVLALSLCALFLIGFSQRAEAASLFDGAVTWEPLKIVTQSEGTHYYQIVLTEKNTIHCHGGSPDLYNPRGEFVGRWRNSRITLEAGTYYAKCEGSFSAWYALEMTPNAKTDIASNITGTVFERYADLQPLELLTIMNEEWSDAVHVYRIVLNEPGKITFKTDSNYSYGDLFDSNGKELTDGDELANDSYNLEAGTYWVWFYRRGWDDLTNFYYVLSNPDRATGITLSQPSATLHLDETIQLGYTLTPAKCDDTVSWSSGNTNVATVDEKGRVTAVGTGECLIIGTTGSKKSASCKLTVLKASPATCRHDYSTVSIVYPTYLRQGYTTYKCKKCGSIYNGNHTSKLILSRGGINYLTAGKRKLVLSYSGISGADGMQIRYSRDKKFKKNTKTVKVKGAYSGSKTLKKLSRRKRYYVQVRGYKKVGKKTVYGKWSAKKSAKVK